LNLLFAISFVLVLGCDSTERNDVRLLIQPTGFSCVEPSPDGGTQALAERALLTRTFSVVVDYIALGGIPSCRPTRLVEWCNGRSCELVRRQCQEVAVTEVQERLDGGLVTIERLNTVVQDVLHDRGPFTDDAPDGPVMIRMTVTTERCAALEGDLATLRLFACSGLVGCAYSCPVQIDAVQGDLDLDYDTLAGVCGVGDVSACSAFALPGVTLMKGATLCMP